MGLCLCVIHCAKYWWCRDVRDTVFDPKNSRSKRAIMVSTFPGGQRRACKQRQEMGVCFLSIDIWTVFQTQGKWVGKNEHTEKTICQSRVLEWNCSSFVYHSRWVCIWSKRREPNTHTCVHTETSTDTHRYTGPLRMMRASLRIRNSETLVTWHHSVDSKHRGSPTRLSQGQ